LRRKGTTSLLMRAFVAATAAAIAFLALGTGSASASTDTATINTFKAWDGQSDVIPFGCPDTTTYGQTITVPAGKTLLNKFTFAWINLGTGSMVVRGEVYAWDGTKATGSALYQSRKRTINFSDGVYHNETFRPNGVSVTPGAQYVLFASIDKDYEQCTNNYELGWGLVSSGDPYPGGGFVYQNNSGNEANWTTVPWNGFGTEDVAFRAYLS
jgi:hypothetical protein